MAADSPGDVFATESHRDLCSVVLFVSTCLSNVFPRAEFREHPRCFAKQLTGGPTCRRKENTCIEDLMTSRLPLSSCAPPTTHLSVSPSVIIKTELRGTFSRCCFTPTLWQQIHQTTCSKPALSTVAFVKMMKHCHIYVIFKSWKTQITLYLFFGVNFYSNIAFCMYIWLGDSHTNCQKHFYNSLGHISSQREIKA